MTRNTEKMFTITASYPFWRHPIQWMRERKSRKLLERLLEYRMNSGEHDTKNKWKEFFKKRVIY